MPFTPLTREEFQSKIAAGFTPQQITQFETRRRQEQGGYGQRVGQALQTSYNEKIAPFIEAGSDLAFGLPRSAVKKFAPDLEGAIFPEQQTLEGKALRFGATTIPAVLTGRALLRGGLSLGRKALAQTPEIAKKIKAADLSLRGIKTSLGREISAVYRGAPGKIQVSAKRLQTVLNQLPDDLMQQLRKLRGLDRAEDGSVLPNLKNIQRIKEVVGDPVTEAAYSGKMATRVKPRNLMAVESTLSKMQSHAYPPVKDLNKAYSEFRKVSSPVTKALRDTQGNYVVEAVANLAKSKDELVIQRLNALAGQSKETKALLDALRTRNIVGELKALGTRVGQAGVTGAGIGAGINAVSGRGQ